MPKYYCDYCDTFLTHDSPSVRKTHNGGRKHKENVRMYYQRWMEEQAQKLVDATAKAFAAGGGGVRPGAAPPPLAPLMGGPPGMGRPPILAPPLGPPRMGMFFGPPGGMGGMPPGMPPPFLMGGPPRPMMGGPPRGMPPRR